ncbi:MAG TPA: sugar ABC transporter substrate-binding protein [Chloroflexota bacterium]|nr:sugar ABC transporter substrate-binding protein [Chloroflexota bacterium]
MRDGRAIHPTRRRLLGQAGGLAGATWLGAACGPGGAREGAAPAAGEPATVGFATLYKEDPSWQLSRQQLADFEAKHPRVRVEADWITGSTTDYLKKLQTYLAGGSQPDVMYVHYLQTAILGSQGVLLDLGRYVQQDKGFNAGDLVEGVVDHFRYRGKPAAVPWYSGPHTLLFNRTLFRRLGVKTPDEYEKEGRWTWETMREAALKLTTGTPGSEGRTLGLSDVSDRLGRWERWTWQNGGELFDEGRRRSQFTSTAAVGAFQFVADLFVKDRVVAYGEEAAQLNPRGSPFLSGRVGMHYGIARDAMTAPVEAAKAAGWELGLVALPKGKGGRQNLDGPQAYAVGAASKAPDAAWELVKWWAAEPQQTQRLQLGASAPVRKSMTRSKAFADSLRPFESVAVLEEAEKTVRAPYSPANLADIERVVSEGWNAILAGEKSVKDALEQMTSQVDPLLQG